MATGTDTAPLNVLLVEDNDIHAYLVRRGLENVGVRNELHRVSNGAEALAYLRHQGAYVDEPAPDLVLLDLKLPKMDGQTVLATIKNDPQLQSIPVVVMTTSDAESDRAQAYRHHANSYVVKPMDFSKFRQLIADLCAYWGRWNQRTAQLTH